MSAENFKMLEIPGYFYDPLTHRYFRGSPPKVISAIDSTKIPTFPTIDLYCIDHCEYNSVFSFYLRNSKLLFCFDPNIIAIGENYLITKVNKMLYSNNEPLVEVFSEYLVWSLKNYVVVSYKNIDESGVEGRTLVKNHNCRTIMINNLASFSFLFRNKCFIVFIDDYVASIDGSWRWQFKSRILAACAHNDFFVISTLGSKIWMFDHRGKLINVFRNFYACSMIIIDQYIIFFANQDGDIFALDTRSKQAKKLVSNLSISRISTDSLCKFLLAFSKSNLFICFEVVNLPIPLFSIQFKDSYVAYSVKGEVFITKMSKTS